jgi:predicted nucleic acid-binding protein
VRLVLDTNILVSSLIRKYTPPYLLYRAWRQQRFDLLTSTHQLSEIEDVLGRPRLQRYVSQEEAYRFFKAHFAWRPPVALTPLAGANPTHLTRNPTRLTRNPTPSGP